MGLEINQWPTHLSANLQYLIKKENIAVHELARRIDIAQPVLQRLLAGTIENPRLKTLIPIASYFGCTIHELCIENLYEDVKVKKFDELKTIRHSIKNKLATLDACLNGILKTLPLLINAYNEVPKEFKNDSLKPKLLAMMPSMLEHITQIISEIENEINQFKLN